VTDRVPRIEDAFLPQDFQPSAKSLSPVKQAAPKLRYICKASEVIEKHLAEEGDLPHWVLDRVNQAAQLMGIAVSYVSFAKEKKFRASGGEETTKVNAVAKNPKKPKTPKIPKKLRKTSKP
jgi:hypothetical protein